MNKTVVEIKASLPDKVRQWGETCEYTAFQLEQKGIKEDKALLIAIDLFQKGLPYIETGFHYSIGENGEIEFYPLGNMN